MSLKKTNEEFITNAMEVHSNKYDYSEVRYKGARCKVKILCHLHGIFEQNPNDHLRGTGCPHCGIAKSIMTRKVTSAQFVKKAKKVHGNVYDYSTVEYKGVKTPVEIICDKHGSFHREPNAHLNGKGCYECSRDGWIKNLRRHTTDSFIESANEVHNFEYDYSLVDYKTMHTKVKIICSKHGIFEQAAGKHLNGHACRYCCRRNHSNKAIQWLNKIAKKEGIAIQHAENGGEYVIAGTRLRADGYCKDTNTVYEYYGDVFHGNPSMFLSEELCHPYDKSITAGELFNNTKKRERIIRDLGYNLIYKWENKE